MTSRLRPILRLVVGPAVVAGFAAFELRGAGHLAEFTSAYSAFAASIFLIDAWGRWQLRLVKKQLERTRRRPGRRTS